jgi:hypothetical protein
VEGVVKEQRILGKDLYLSPQPSLTSYDSQTVNDTYSTQERDVITNTRLRLLEIEDRLIKLGFIKGTYVP